MVDDAVAGRVTGLRGNGTPVQAHLPTLPLLVQVCVTIALVVDRQRRDRD